MENTITYSGYYKDTEREVSIDITNDFDELSFTLDGLRFSSSDMEEWKLINENECSEEQFDKFTLSTSTSREAFNLVTEYFLRDCILSINMPQRALDKQTIMEVELDLIVTITLERENTIDLKIEIDSNVIEEKNISLFENGLKKINNQLNKTHGLFNCFNCRYSSYSIYGQPVFGNLLCYKKHKERFLKVKNKEEYSWVQDQGHESVQETAYCEEFQLPDKEQFLYK